MISPRHLGLDLNAPARSCVGDCGGVATHGVGGKVQTMEWLRWLTKGATYVNTLITVFKAVAMIITAVNELRAAEQADPALKEKIDAAHAAVKAVADHSAD